MTVFESFRFALQALAANKLRSALTMLGIIIGVAAVIALVSVGRAFENVVSSQFAGLGSNLLFVFPGQPGPGGNAPRRPGFGLTMDDVAAVSDQLAVPDALRIVPEYSGAAEVSRLGESLRTRVTGTTIDYPDLRDFQPVLGRFFDQRDNAAAARVAVIGQTVYEELFPNGEIPIDELIKINGVNFRIIGLMEEKGGSGFEDQDEVILVPLASAQRRLFPARRSDGKVRIDFMYVQITDESRQNAAITQIELRLRETRQIALGEDNDFSVLSQAEILGAFAQITGVITLFLGTIAGISLLVGGIGIMNIMLVSVTERTREIGLRKAVGARQSDILWQFLIEAMTLALAGGIIGFSFGAAGGIVLAEYAGFDPLVDLTSAVQAISVSAAVGLIFGLFPAYRASRLNPIEALRYE